MASIAEVKAILSQIDEQETRIVRSIQSVAEQSGQSLARLRILVGGSSHPAAVQALARAERSRQLLVEAAALAEHASTSTVSYRALLG